jgi:hypothetical protein
LPEVPDELMPSVEPIPKEAPGERVKLPVPEIMYVPQFKIPLSKVFASWEILLTRLTVPVLTISTGFPEIGTIPPIQVPGKLQFPPLAVLVIFG